MRRACHAGNDCCSRAPPRDAPVEQGSRLVHCHDFHSILNCKMQGDYTMKPSRRIALSALTVLVVMLLPITQAVAQQQRPNIVFIMGDDIGWFNIGAYHQGMMASRTPNLDKLAAEGMRFTDYYAEASCTAGRANFITGEPPIRTDLTSQEGSPLGMPDNASSGVSCSCSRK